MIWTPLLGLVLLWVAATLRGMRSAFTSLSAIDLHHLVAGGPAQKRLGRLAESYRREVDGSLWIGQQLATLAVVIAAARSARTAGVPLWPLLLALPPLLLITVELVPRLLGRRFRGLLSRLGGWPLIVTVGLFAPLRIPTTWLARSLTRWVGLQVEDEEEGLDEAELLMLLDRGADLGVLDPHEVEFAESVFEFDDIPISRLMTPRPDIFSLPLNIPMQALRQRAAEAGYSRIPIYEERSDEIIGVLLLKDLLQIGLESGPDRLRSLLLPPRFVPPNKSAADMLHDFMAGQYHMGFVVDEHGTLIGLITLDDLLDALVGELEEENDEILFRRIHPHVLWVKATLALDDFEEETGVTIPEGDYHTIGGFLFHELGQVPKPGDAVELQGHRFRVRSMEGRRIDEIDVRPVQRAEAM